MFTLPSGIREKQTNMWNNSLQDAGHETMKDSDAGEMSLSITPDNCLRIVSRPQHRRATQEDTEMRTYKEHCS